MSAMSEFVSTRDACKLLGISYMTLWRWIKEGKIRVVKSSMRSLPAME